MIEWQCTCGQWFNQDILAHAHVEPRLPEPGELRQPTPWRDADVKKMLKTMSVRTEHWRALDSPTRIVPDIALSSG